MQKLIALTLFILISIFNFSVQKNTLNPETQLHNNCTTDQIDMVKVAILECETNSAPLSTVCIRDYIRQNNVNQVWNVFIKNVESNLDSVAFWYMNNCVVQLNNFGTLSHNYIVWNYKSGNKSLSNQHSQTHNSLILNADPAQSDNKNHNRKDLSPLVVDNNRANTNNRINLKQINSQQSNDCPQWKKFTVIGIFSTCDLPKMDHSAYCIMDRIKKVLGDYWDVYVSTSQTSPSAVASFYIQCAITKETFGTYSRFINVWRTVSIVNPP